VNPPSARTLVQSLLGAGDAVSDSDVALQAVGGGDSHPALRLQTGAQQWFVKWNRCGSLPAFEAERDGLKALAEGAEEGLHVPVAMTVGNDSNHAWLILRWHELRPHGDAAALGAGLARLHQNTGPAHGWPQDNFIGRMPQENRQYEDWARFWWERRLLPQLTRARSTSFGRRLASHLGALERLSATLLDHNPPPSLLHGDLWGGNHGYLPSGQPVLFDPAAYYGDRETDLAMMRLFGGFDPQVLAAYEAAWPLPAGAAQRTGLYQLYHLLNHLNLFGESWADRVEQTILQLRLHQENPV